MDGRENWTGVQGQPSDQILRQAVKNASSYTSVMVPGSLQPGHLLPAFSTELVLLTLPDGVNPMKLINSEVVVGGKKDSLVLAGRRRYRVATYPATQDTTCIPSLFLPDQDGQLTKVTSDVKAFLVVKGEVEEKEEDNKGCVNIEALRSVPCKMSEDLPRRDFLAKRWKADAPVEGNQQDKKKKKSLSRMPDPENSNQPKGNVHSPRKKKKNLDASPVIKTSESSTNNHEVASHTKKRVKVETPEHVGGDKDLLLPKGRKKIRT